MFPAPARMLLLVLPCLLLACADRTPEAAGPLGKQDGGAEGEAEGQQPGEGEGEGVAEEEGETSPEDAGQPPDTGARDAGDQPLADAGRPHLDQPGEGEGEGKHEGEGEGAPGIPEIRLEPTEIDFGYVAQGNAVMRFVEVFSVGAGPLEITKVELSAFTSHDFVTSEVPEPPITLPPGSSFTFRVHYLPSDELPDEGAVFLHSNDPARPQIGLILRAREKESPSRLEVAPTELNFGQVAIGATVTREFVCRNIGGMPFDVNAADLLPGGANSFAVVDAAQFPFELLPGQVQGVEVTFTPRAAGAATAELQVDSDALSTRTARVTLRGEGVAEAQPCIEVSPRSLIFGAVRRGEDKTMSFQLVSCGSVPLRVTALDRGLNFGTPLTPEFQIQQLQLPLILQPGQRATVQITYAPGVEGIDLGFLEVVNNSPTPRVRIDLSASGLQPRLEEVNLHIRLTWNTNNCDVDLHLLRENFTLFDCEDDCHYQVLNPDWGVAGTWQDDPFLDVDDVSGLGPENINLQAPVDGRYKIVVHYWLDSYDGSPSVDTDATIELFNLGQPIGSWTQHLDSTDWTWDVAWVDFPGAVVTPILTTYRFDRNNFTGCFGFGR